MIAHDRKRKMKRTGVSCEGGTRLILNERKKIEDNAPGFGAAASGWARMGGFSDNRTRA
jgi:hypothetical protein